MGSGNKISSIHILSVEDDQVIVQLVKAALKSVNSCEVKLSIADDGEKGLACLDGNKAQYDLVILDLNLPRVHGLEILKVIKASEKTKNIPVVIFSTTSDQISKAYELGANSCIVKPAEFEDYKKLFRSICEFWSQNTAAPR